MFAAGYEIADYAELCTWQNGIISKERLIKQLSRLDDNDYSEGGVPEDDIKINLPIEEAFGEIESRVKICEGGYPFSFSDNGNTIYLTYDFSNYRHVIYFFLLLATRLDMAHNRNHAGYDGTKLFEELSAEILLSYFGEGSKSCVFGDLSGSFEEKINKLCQYIGEGKKFINRDNRQPRKKDDGLDVVVWKDFSDNCVSKLLGFAQCKTGTNYLDSMSILYPDKFCSKWMLNMPVVRPLRIFLVAEALSRITWYTNATDAGLFFDRCRVIDYGERINSEVLTRIMEWTAAAAEITDLPIDLLKP